MSTVATLNVLINANPSGLRSGLKAANSDVQGFGAGVKSKLDSVGLGGALAFGAISAAALKFGADSIRASIGFEESMTNVNSILQLSQQGIDDLSGKVLAFGATTRFGPQAQAEAYYEIASGVADMTTHMAILEAATATAEAGNADLLSTTGAMVSVMNSYGFAASEANFASDVLTKTVQAGVGSMDEFSQAMGLSAGLAASAGIKFDDLGGSMAYLTTKGFSAANAGTRLTAVITAFLKPNEKMTKALRAMGLESGSAGLEMYGLAGMTGRLEEALGGSQDAMAAALGTTEALTGAIALNNPGFEEFIGNFRETAGGATEAARAIQNMSTASHIDHLNSQVEALKIGLGDLVAPVLDITVTAVVETIDTWTHDIPEQARILGTIIGTKIKEGTEAGLNLVEILLGVTPEDVKLAPKDVGGSIREKVDEVLQGLGAISPSDPVYLSLTKIQTAADVADTITAAINTQMMGVKPVDIMATAALNLLMPDAAQVITSFNAFVGELNATGLSPSQTVIFESAVAISNLAGAAQGVRDSLSAAITAAGLIINTPPTWWVDVSNQVGSAIETAAAQGDPLILSFPVGATPVMPEDRRSAFNAALGTILADGTIDTVFEIDTSISATPYVDLPPFVTQVVADIQGAVYAATVQANLTVRPIPTILSTGVPWVDQALAGVQTAVDAATPPLAPPLAPATGTVTGVPGHASGLGYVPYDGYLAQLHQGERVLTRGENAAVRNGARGMWAAPDMPGGRSGGGRGNVTVNVQGGNYLASRQDVVEWLRDGAREAGL